MLRGNSDNLRREIKDLQRGLAVLRFQAREQYIRHEAVVARQAEIHRYTVNQDDRDDSPLPEELKELLVRIEREEEYLECLEADLRLVEDEEKADAQDDEYARQYDSQRSGRF